jgi:hypothetical protein
VLRSTFLHVPGVGVKTERGLWASGVLRWKDCPGPGLQRLSAARQRALREAIPESARRLEAGDARFFGTRLPSSQLWRLFQEFRSSTAYLDIETTGMDGWGMHITTIALYDGRTVRHYVHEENLREFVEDIRPYRLIVTYNGRCFDVPVLRQQLLIPMDQVHIDLRFVLSALGYRGGLKGCERQLGLDRRDLDGVDGYFAVLLWDEFVRNRNLRALETLLAYNMEDVVNLEALMVMAYNLNLRGTPFEETHRLPMPERPEIPFAADRETIARIRYRLALSRTS